MIHYKIKNGFFQFPFRLHSIMLNNKKTYVFYEFFGNPSKISSIENDEQNEKILCFFVRNVSKIPKTVFVFSEA